MATMSEKLRWYIFEHRGISQKEFALESDIEEGTISRILNDKQYPSIPTLMMIRDATRLWGDYWLDDSAPVPPPKKYFVK